MKKMVEKIDKQLQKHLNWWQEKSEILKGRKSGSQLRKLRKRIHKRKQKRIGRKYDAKTGQNQQLKITETVHGQR